MDINQLLNFVPRAPIPEDFYSFDTGAPMNKCLMCSRNLLEEGVQYVIEKAVKNYKEFGVKDVIFEYAVCMECADSMRSEMSEESMLAIQKFFMENASIMKRTQYLLMEKESLEMEDWIGKCLITDIAASDAEEFQLYGHFEGEEILFTHMPYMLSMKALDEIVNLLSNKTLDSMDGFRDKYFDLPPGIKDKLPERDLFLF